MISQGLGAELKLYQYGSTQNKLANTYVRTMNNKSADTIPAKQKMLFVALVSSIY